MVSQSFSGCVRVLLRRGGSATPDVVLVAGIPLPRQTAEAPSAIVPFAELLRGLKTAYPWELEKHVQVSFSPTSDGDEKHRLDYGEISTIGSRGVPCGRARDGVLECYMHVRFTDGHLLYNGGEECGEKPMMADAAEESECPFAPRGITWDKMYGENASLPLLPMAIPPGNAVTGGLLPPWQPPSASPREAAQQPAAQGLAAGMGASNPAAAAAAAAAANAAAANAAAAASLLPLQPLLAETSWGGGVGGSGFGDAAGAANSATAARRRRALPAPAPAALPPSSARPPEPAGDASSAAAVAAAAAAAALHPHDALVPASRKTGRRGSGKDEESRRRMAELLATPLPPRLKSKGKAQQRARVKTVDDLRLYAEFIGPLWERYRPLTGYRQAIGKLVGMSCNRLGELKRMYEAATREYSADPEVARRLKDPTAQLCELIHTLRAAGWKKGSRPRSRKDDGNASDASGSDEEGAPAEESGVGTRKTLSALPQPSAGSKGVARGRCAVSNGPAAAATAASAKARRAGEKLAAASPAKAAEAAALAAVNAAAAAINASAGPTLPARKRRIRSPSPDKEFAKRLHLGGKGSGGSGAGSTNRQQQQWQKQEEQQQPQQHQQHQQEQQEKPQLRQRPQQQQEQQQKAVGPAQAQQANPSIGDDGNSFVHRTAPAAAQGGRFAHSEGVGGTSSSRSCSGTLKVEEMEGIAALGNGSQGPLAGANDWLAISAALSPLPADLTAPPGSSFMTPADLLFGKDTTEPPTSRASSSNGSIGMALNAMSESGSTGCMSSLGPPFLSRLHSFGTSFSGTASEEDPFAGLGGAWLANASFSPMVHSRPLMMPDEPTTRPPTATAAPPAAAAPAPAVPRLSSIAAGHHGLDLHTGSTSGSSGGGSSSSGGGGRSSGSGGSYAYPPLMMCEDGSGGALQSGSLAPHRQTSGGWSLFGTMALPPAGATATAWLTSPDSTSGGPLTTLATGHRPPW